MGKENTDSAPRRKMTNDGGNICKGWVLFHIGDDQEVNPMEMGGSGRDRDHVAIWRNMTM